MRWGSAARLGRPRGGWLALPAALATALLVRRMRDRAHDGAAFARVRAAS